MAGDWTEELFIRHGDLYQVLLEGMFPRAEEETRGLARLLAGRGFGTGAAVLDLNCRIGRHAIHLARLGYRVVGVDMSPRYIQRAGQLAIEHGVAGDSEFLVADARKVGEALSGRKFDAVINMFTSLGYYDEETDRSIIRQCLGLVRSGGIFVLETGSRDSISRNFQPFGVFRVDDLLLLHEREFSLETSRMKTVWTFLETIDEGYRLSAEIHLNHRFYCLHELIRLFEEAGWHYRASYRDFEFREPSLDGNRLILVCQSP
ncbi:MAG: class I SAM-dependent methyltransferase [Dehalococcoidia bacterium]|nr:class I SAM-dependent methyltransferase [Dehalococcoidia bacterium]